MILGLNHITLAVRDAEASFRFYLDVLQFRPRARWPSGAYFLAGDVWLALVEDPQVREGPLLEYTHFAFSVAASDFDAAAERIVGSGARIWKENTTEGSSLYFLDPNHHKLELHVGSLSSRLAECRAHPWPGLQLFD